MDDVQLDQGEVLAQLAHEASSLALAVRRMRRSGEYKPVSKGLLEEAGDVVACLSLLQLSDDDMAAVKRRSKNRVKRWSEELKS